jgi:hypothetical protein
MTDPENKPDLRPEDYMAVDSTPDSVRMAGNPDETEMVTRNDGSVLPVDDPHDETPSPDGPQSDDS